MTPATDEERAALNLDPEAVAAAVAERRALAVRVAALETELERLLLEHATRESRLLAKHAAQARRIRELGDAQEAPDALLAAAHALGNLYDREQRALEHQRDVRNGQPLATCPTRSEITTAQLALLAAYRRSRR